MDNIAGKKAGLTWAIHISVVVLVALWLFPTLGLFVSSFRTADQISGSGWWAALSTQERQLPAARLAGDEVIIDGRYVISGELFPNTSALVSAWGISAREPEANVPGDTVALEGEVRLLIDEEGRFVLSGPDSFEGQRLPRVFSTAAAPPEFTLANYERVLFTGTADAGVGNALLNTATVAIPATVIPILIAAFAAYALAWMDFPGRALLVALVVALLVVPLQLALIPLLQLHNTIGIGKGYIGTWLAHTGFGMPLAIYLLRNYMVGLPRDIIESAKVDGATDFQVFTKIVLPLSFPALAAFAIFQFLWTWNDLLVALVFLGTDDRTLVLTGRLVNLMGSRGGDWEILATSAFVSIAVPLVVFFTMQRYLVRGLLAGSVK
ncbi:carbohydrate ABC transporter permease [Roseicyclus mahoneyensis]|uniref:Maltose ABC transporter membrane protein /trehalose ABC transporter membrane protein /sucrose ABC transporter membrane protein n=1 Tax=Roseicyclus mahoneyensis TaxID=164332 RepID=A0A316GNI4_9RHOB|nr:carbohydrate ABC transporter permease [Roseicyclus mahoneyensis]PWK62605.1 maltose ABC transporter membrane protein /trehalose ABC transporter membrane protein /sucrose ABC transporter membrane protein [Roseicyclus mahoneyensis]